MSKQLKKSTIGEHAGTARFHAYNVGLAIDLNDTIAAIIFHHFHMNIEKLVENKYVDDDGVGKRNFLLQFIFNAEITAEHIDIRYT